MAGNTPIHRRELDGPKKNGPPMTHGYRCDFCRQYRLTSDGRKRVRGIFWRCKKCEEKVMG